MASSAIEAPISPIFFLVADTLSLITALSSLVAG
jgi:hypothetical protein